MAESVYIETSIAGYLTVRPSNNIIVMANAAATRSWWDTQRARFSLYISEIILDEVGRGDAEMARNRLETLANLPLVEINQSVQGLAIHFVNESNLPSKAADDALHIAAATVHRLNYLLTWNCKHIANAKIQKKLAQISLNAGYELPIICTPYELMEE
ncbi:MAG: DNA-binding protein [Leptolyngbya sp.]|nr:MAG: DNA-binding protein [Leptolyngbya sp.]